MPVIVQWCSENKKKADGNQKASSTKNPLVRDCKCSSAEYAYRDTSSWRFFEWHEHVHSIIWFTDLIEDGHILTLQDSGFMGET